MNRRSLYSVPGIVVAVAIIVTGFVLTRERQEGGDSAASRVHVAVAANFTDAIKDIVPRFEARTGYEVVLSFGSTGKHYAQIKNGAPFDVFFAADVARPERLEAEGAAVPGSRFTYAVGRLVLWSPVDGYVDANGDVLRRGGFRHLAIANPKLAPYGQAAQEALEALGLREGLQEQIVRGETIAQALQFVQGGSAELGFVAFAQVKRPGGTLAGSYWEVPQSLHAPIEQQVVLLREGVAARALLDFVRGDEALEIIRSYGYSTP